MIRRCTLASGLVLVVLAGAAVAGDGLGTLFTSEPERAALDAGRPTDATPADGLPVSAPAAPQRVKLSGALVSSSGQRRFWIDDRAGGVTTTAEQARVLDAGHVRMENTNGTYQSVRPGQVLDRDAGSVYESYLLNRDAGVGSAPAPE